MTSNVFIGDLPLKESHKNLNTKEAHESPMLLRSGPQSNVESGGSSEENFYSYKQTELDSAEPQILIGTSAEQACISSSRKLLLLKSS